MKNKLSIFLLGLITVFTFAACEEEEPVFDGPYDLLFTGPTHVVPGTSEVYSIGEVVNPDSYTWTVAGPATIVSDATGETIEVAFTGVGEVVLTATNGTETTEYHIEVEAVEPVVMAEMDSVGSQLRALTEGDSARVFFQFAAPVESVSLEGIDSEGFDSGSILSGTELQRVDENTFYLDYEAGAGNGTPEVLLTNIIATAEYGADTVDSAYVQIYRVDNFNPIADISYSDELVATGEEVEVNVTFNEEVTLANPSDSAMYVTFTVGGVTMTDTLVATEDPLVYTYEYTAQEGEGMVEVGLDNIADYAGNSDIIIENGSDLMIDNTAPELLETATSAIDEGDYADITITANEAGTGMYLITAADAAAVTAENFMTTSGVASGSVELEAGALFFSDSAVESLEAGEYMVYYMAMDEAGNTSAIVSSTLTMD